MRNAGIHDGITLPVFALSEPDRWDMFVTVPGMAAPKQISLEEVCCIYHWLDLHVYAYFRQHMNWKCACSERIVNKPYHSDKLPDTANFKAKIILFKKEILMYPDLKVFDMWYSYSIRTRV